MLPFVRCEGVTGALEDEIDCERNTQSESNIPSKLPKTYLNKSNRIRVDVHGTKYMVQQILHQSFANTRSRSHFPCELSIK